MLIIVRSPESPNRPEKYIADAICNYARQKGIDFREVSVDQGVDPMSGAMFYDHATFMNNFLGSAAKLWPLLEHYTNARVLFIEGLNPAIPILRYYLTCIHSNARLYGIFHSSCHIPGDLFQFSEPMQGLEHWLLNHGLDGVFVASAYMANTLMKAHEHSKSNILITGLPFDHMKIPDSTKAWPLLSRVEPIPKPIVIWNHRWAADKRKEVFTKLAITGQDRCQFRILTSSKIDEVLPECIDVRVCPTRDIYFDELRKGNIIFSSAQLETFGYSVLEGVLLGLMPFLIDHPVYEDFYGDQFLWQEKKLCAPALLLYEMLAMYQHVLERPGNWSVWKNNTSVRFERMRPAERMLNFMEIY